METFFHLFTVGKKKLCRLFMKEDLKVSLLEVPSKNVIWKKEVVI